MIYNIQALRALAALLVVCVHLDTVLAPAGVRPADVLFGAGGVDLFFVISGFVMVYTTARRPVTAGAFLLNRIMRVVPLYWLVTLALFGIALIMPSLLGASRAAPLDLARSLLFIPFVKANGLVQPLFFLGWTLNYEMFFYALFAAALALSGGRIARTTWLAAAALLALLLVGLAARPAGVIARFYTDPILIEFAFGMALGLLHWRGLTMNRWLALALAVAGAMLLLGQELRPAQHRAIYAGVPGLMIVAAMLSLEARGWAWRARPVQLVGAASYALYLCHPFVTQALARLSARIGSPAAAIGLAALAVMLALGVAVIVHLQVERRLALWLRHAAGHPRPIVERVEAREITGP